MRATSPRRQRLRSPRALALYLALSTAGAAALAFSCESEAAAGEARLWKEGDGTPVVAGDHYDPRRSLAPLIKAISPAVVSIRTTGKGPQGAAGGVDPRMLPFLPQMPEQPLSGIGSGFIISGDGLVITNNHVVEGSEKLEVKLADGRLFSAKVLGRDPHTDVAVVKLEGASGLPSVRLGSSDGLAVGDWVLAIGSPMGLEQTATTGIVSAKKRGSLGLYGNSYVDFLQTDAAISPGNSGGPLFNLDGEVIGINTAISAMGRGIGFAVPIDQAKAVIPQLHASGKVERGWLGIAGRDVEPAVGVAPQPGAVVGEIHSSTPAAKAGLRAGDRIVSVDGKAIENFSDLRGRIAESRPGAKIKVGVERGGKRLELPVTLGALPSDDELRRLAAGSPGPESAGPGGGDLYGSGGPRLGVDVDPRDDTRVKAVRPGSIAADLGLRPGDRITEINGQPIKGRADIGRALARDRRRVEVSVDRGGSTFTSVIERR
ncbi:MAG: trypsin-like peptidase domain-containing protein [Myxococcales bacterium]|nr:trypsin-like peptidase domain-containing protein [Myxococcales bacterium]